MLFVEVRPTPREGISPLFQNLRVIFSTLQLIPASKTKQLFSLIQGTAGVPGIGENLPTNFARPSPANCSSEVPEICGYVIPVSLESPTPKPKPHETPLGTTIGNLGNWEWDKSFVFRVVRFLLRKTYLQGQ